MLGYAGGHLQAASFDAATVFLDRLDLLEIR